MFEWGVRRYEAGSCHAASVHHPHLKLCELGKRIFDAFLNCTNLNGEFESGIFNHLFAHGCSFPGT
jgi:hypothetical protein